MKSEIFKDIPEYEGLYQVSNLGRVKTIKSNTRVSNPEGIISPDVGHAYVRVPLWKNNKMKHKMVHRLVALVFIGDSELQVNHKNGNKQDNRVENLEYVTPSENVIHGFDTGLIKRDHFHKPVILTKPDGNRLRYLSIKEAAEDTGIKANYITQCVTGRRKATQGCTFEYDNGYAVPYIK